MKRVRFLLAVPAFFMVACAARHSDTGGGVSALLRSEKAFGELAAQKSTKQAFLAYLADGSVLFCPGPVDGRKWYQQRPEKPGILSWEPAHAEMAKACDLGYTTGPWEFRKGGAGEEPVAYGDYVSIWKRLPDGSWKLALDAGIEHVRPSPQSAPLLSQAASETRCESPSHVLDPRAQVDALIREDGVFSDLSAAKGAKAAYMEYGSGGLRYYRDEAFAVIGLKPVLEVLRRPGGTITWKPMGAEVSASGDLGYTYGLSHFARSAGSPVSDESAYVRIWRRESEGRWRVILDLATPVPAPGPS